MEIFIQSNAPTPWSAYGGKHTVIEKIFRSQMVSPAFNYQRGIPAFDKCINEKSASETIFLGILRKGYYLQLNSKMLSAVCLLGKNELQKIKLDAFKVKVSQHEKLAAYLTISVNSHDKIRCFVPAGKYNQLIKFFEQKEFRQKFELTIDPNPPLEQIKLVDIISGFGNPGN